MLAIKTLFASLLPFVAGACAGATPAAPGLTFLYSLNCTLAAAIPVGDGPHGSRVVIPIVGGTFSGPKLNGMTSRAGVPTSQCKHQDGC